MLVDMHAHVIPGALDAVGKRQDHRGPHVGPCDDERARLLETDRIQFKASDAFYSAERLDPAAGFGLLIARRIVEETFGGTLRCESRPGGGATFVATFVDVTGIVIYFTIASIYLL